jgi:CDP-glucose 4,6-dehydratase
MTLAQRLVEHGPVFAEAWNFGPLPHDEQPVGWIVQNLARLWGDGAAWTIDKGPHPHEANHLRLDISKAQALLDWSPSLGLQQALEKVVDWYKDRAAGQDVRDLTLRQIQTYHNSLLRSS